MIDTEKYDGHTPAPWKAENKCYRNGVDENNLGQVSSYLRTWGVTLSEEKLSDCRANRIGYNVMHKADAQLIADAPILLSEYKRLRGLLDRIDDVVYYYNEKDGHVLPVEKPNLELLRDIMMSYVDEAYQIRGDEGRWIE